MGETAQGVVLAGGRARRFGGAKATALLGARPILLAPIEAMRQAGLVVAVVAKSETRLPDLGADVAVLREPDATHHPLVAIAHALRVFGAPIVVCAGDMPFVPTAVFAMLAQCDAPITVIATDTAVQPLLGRYTPQVLADIDAAVAAGRSVRGLLADRGGCVQTIGVDQLRAFGDPERFTRDIDTPDDLRDAEAALHTQTR